MLAVKVIMLALIEIPLVGYEFRAAPTAVAVERFSDWLARRGGRAALIAGGVIGAARWYFAAC